MSLLLLRGPIAAQNIKDIQHALARRLIVEVQKLVDEGSAASRTKALERLETAKTLAHSLNNVPTEAALLLEIGDFYVDLDQYQKALETYAQSLALFRASRDRKGEAVSRFHLGLIHTTLGESQKALDTLHQAVMLFRAAGDREDEANALAVIGYLHFILGKYEEALSDFNDILKISRATGLREMEALVLGLIAALYRITGQTQKAQETLEQCLSVARSVEYAQGETEALIAFGFLYIYLVDPQKALKYFEQALSLARAEHYRSDEGTTLFGLCSAYTISHDYQKAFEYCSEAVAIFRALGDRQREAHTLKFLAFAELNRGNLVASKTAIESCIAIVESLRTKVINPDLRLSFFTASQSYYEFDIALLMRLHKQHPNEGYDGKALEASERARARSLLETLMEANADIRQGVDAELLHRKRETQRRLNARARTQMLLLLSPSSETQASEIAEEIKTLIKDLQQVETEIRQTSPRYGALTQPQPLTLKEIQNQVLDQDTLLLEYSLGDNRSYLWVVASNSVTSHELPDRFEIETAARQFYELLNARNVRFKDESNEQRANRIAEADVEIPLAAARLSRMVLGPIAEELRNKRLVIVADGALHFVPFGALPVATGGISKPLIVDHEIVNLPSASTLSMIRREVAGHGLAPKSLAILADPVFVKTDERVKRIKEKTSNTAAVDGESTTNRQLVKAAAEDTGIASDGLYIPRLPGTRHEAERIAAMVPATDRWLALDFAASRDTATSAELGQYRYVHFSTHGFLNSVHPELSGVALSLVNERGESQDGFLRAHELFNLKLPAEVVVLSACQTGIGKNIRGEGLVSLTRGFMYAGAPRVVVSLWGVNDWATTELMVRFYDGMLKKGMRPAAALRAAQISLMNDKRWESPYFWAPFTLQGEWR